jgi:hypothetical protein
MKTQTTPFTREKAWKNKKANPGGVRCKKIWSTRLDGNANRFSALSIQNGIDMDGNTNPFSVWLKLTTSVVCEILFLNRVKSGLIRFLDEHPARSPSWMETQT